MTAEREIAVIGAGVGGLAVAIALRQYGHRVTVFERFAESRPVGSGLMLQPAGLAALGRLGLRGRMEALGARIDRLHGITDRGRIVFDLAYADLDPSLHALAVHRAALHAVLWNGFAASGATIETGRTITALAARAGGRVGVVDAAGRGQGAFELVVDSSGARSVLRGVVTRDTARPFTYGAVWASVPDIGVAPHALAQRYVGAHVMLGYLPVGRVTEHGPQLAALFWSLKPSAYGAWKTGYAAWLQDVARLWPELGPMVAGLAGPDFFSLAEYQHFTARRPYRGAVALIGDAAHATSPQLGQGANNALLDALALADALRVKPDIEAALAAYAQTRRRHVRFYQMASAVMTPFFQSDSGIAAELRD